MARCFIALGGNLGSVEETFRRALHRLNSSSGVAVTRMSRNFRSFPVGEAAGGAFQNAAAELETDLEPLELLDLLQMVEVDEGRIRNIQWGPRTLDLDLILYADQILEMPRLLVPHPACWYRRFVLDPMNDIAADILHPERRATFAALRAALVVRPFRVEFAGGIAQERASLVEQLEIEFPKVHFSEWYKNRGSGTLPALIVRLDDEIEFDRPSAQRSVDLSHAGEESFVFLRDILQSALDELQPPAAEDAVDEPHAE